MEQLTPFAALIGIDWSDAKHDICLVETATGAQELSVVKHTPESLNEWARALRSRFGGERIAVCLEQSRGSLIYALLKYDFLTLYPINPQMLSRFREAFTPSRAKDDPTDAEYLVELLIHHRERLKAWMPDDERTRTLQLLVEHRRRLVGDQTRISKRLTALLKGYFPQVLQWFPDIRTPMVCDFLLRWSSLDALHGVRRTTLEKFFREHNSRAHRDNREATCGDQICRGVDHRRGSHQFFGGDGQGTRLSDEDDVGGSQRVRPRDRSVVLRARRLRVVLQLARCRESLCITVVDGDGVEPGAMGNSLRTLVL